MTKLTRFFATTVFAAVAVVSVGVAQPAEAATLSASQIQAVVSLLQSFGVDATAITTVQQTLSTAQTSAPAVSTTTLNANTIGFLRLGDKGDRVKFLQVILAADPSIYPEGLISGFFGGLTEKALKRYQHKHGLEQVGFIGPRTLRELDNELEDNPISTEDDEDGDDDSDISGGRRVCAIVPPGHLIAPGWLKKNNGIAPIVPTCQTLPPGIAKKLGTGTGTGTTTDAVAPVISEISVDSITTTSAEVEWKTNEKATSVVNFGTTTAYGTSVSKGSTRSTSHSVALSSLLSGTVYHYRVTSVDASGNTATSSDRTFTTLSSGTADTTAPIISDLSVGSIDSDSAKVEWDTDEDTTGKVYYSTATPLDVATASSLSSSTLDDSHDFDLTALTASTAYYYLVVSADAAGNTATSSESSFTTLAP